MLWTTLNIQRMVCFVQLNLVSPVHSVFGMNCERLQKRLSVVGRYAEYASSLSKVYSQARICNHSPRIGTNGQ